MAEEGVNYPEFAKDLINYHQLIEQIPDTIVLELARAQDIAIQINQVVWLLLPALCGIGLIRAIKQSKMTQGESMVGIFVWIAIVVFSLTPDQSNIRFDEETLPDAVFEEQPKTSLYILKAGLAVTRIFHRRFNSMILNSTNGVPGEQIQRLMSDFYLGAIRDTPGTGELKRLANDYINACNPVITEARKKGLITTAGAGSIGLFGGQGLGFGYTFEDPQLIALAGSEQDFLTVAGDAYIGPDLELLSDRIKAAEYLYNFGKTPFAPNNPTINRYYVIHSRDFWLSHFIKADESALRNSGESDAEALIASFTSPTISLRDHPFEAELKGVLPHASASAEDLKIYENTAYLQDCRDYYLAAESAMTAYFDAIYDYEQWKTRVANGDGTWSIRRNTEIPRIRAQVRQDRDFFSGADEIVGIAETSVVLSRRQIFREMEGLQGQGASGLEYVASFMPGGANMLVNRARNGDITADAKWGIASILTKFKEETKGIEVLQSISTHIMIIESLYIALPIIMAIGIMISPGIISTYLKLFMAAWLGLIVAAAITAMGITQLNSIATTKEAGMFFLQGGSGEITAQNLEQYGVHYAMLAAVGIVEFSIAAMIIFQDFKSYGRAGGDTLGIASGVSAIMKIATIAIVTRGIGGALGMSKAPRPSSAGGSAGNTAAPQRNGPSLRNNTPSSPPPTPRPTAAPTRYT